MKLFNKVAIIGTGLIGGSIGLAIKRKRLAKEIVGFSRRKKNLLLAVKRGAINRGSGKLDIVRDADLVILATPVNSIINLAPRIANIIRKDCIVTDVGSTKSKIVSCLVKIFPNYVGSHPLAGSQKSSIVNANPDIFKDSICILTPVRNTNSNTLNKMNLFWRQLGASTILLTPSTHDKILSFVSHLPHVVAFSLMGVIPCKYLKFASAGLKDTTRIAASDSQAWADILLSNQKNILKTIGLLQSSLARMKLTVTRQDRDALIKILKQAKLRRNILK